MPDIYAINSRNIIGGPGRLVWAPFGTTAPAGIADVMGTAAPYDLTGAWRDLGATNGGISIIRGFDTADFEVDQVKGAVDTDITAWHHTLTTNLAENTVENRQLALIGGSIIETAATLGAGTTTASAAAAGATILQVTASAGFAEGGWLTIGGQTIRISRIQGTTIYLEEPLNVAAAAAAAVSPVTTLGTKRIGYGAVSDVPLIMVALISQKKDGTLGMAVFRKCKVTGDDKEQAFSKDKRLLPLSLAAYPDDDAPATENVFYEIEQVR